MVLSGKRFQQCASALVFWPLLLLKAINVLEAKTEFTRCFLTTVARSSRGNPVQMDLDNSSPVHIDGGFT